MHISDALNGKPVDWPEIFRKILTMELRTIKEELFKDKTTGMKTMIGPPLTMLLIAEGLLSVQQEVEAGILTPSVLEACPVSKKRKQTSEPEATGTERGESSVQKATTVEVALIQPEPTVHHHTCITSIALQEILGKFEQTNLTMERTFQEWVKVIPQQVPNPPPIQPDGTTEQIKIEQLEQQIRDMSIKKEHLTAKLGCLHEQHLQELYERNRIEQALQTKIQGMNANMIHKNESIRGTLNQLQQIRVTVVDLNGENKALKTFWRINGTLREIDMRKQLSIYTT